MPPDLPAELLPSDAPSPRLALYVDGFNLYNRALRPNPSCKWLNLHALFRRLLPVGNIVSLSYFTAWVSNSPSNPGQWTRQKIYIRALSTLNPMDIVFGQFKERVKRMRVADQDHDEMMNPLKDRRGLKVPYSLYNREQQRVYRVLVVKSDEKGSDVNLASHLLRDAFLDKFDVAAIITNDSDLVEPIKIANRHGKKVGVLSPHTTCVRELSRWANFVKIISPADLAASQFPRVLSDAAGSFHRPERWD